MFNDRVKTRMDELNAQKAEITASMAELELASGFQLTRDHIAFFLRQFRDADMTDRNCQKRLIQTFVNAVLVYDDKIKIVFNYAADSNTITLETIENLEVVDNDSGFVCRTECSSTSTKKTDCTSDTSCNQYCRSGGGAASPSPAYYVRPRLCVLHRKKEQER